MVKLKFIIMSKLMRADLPAMLAGINITAEMLHEHRQYLEAINVTIPGNQLNRCITAARNLRLEIAEYAKIIDRITVPAPGSPPDGLPDLDGPVF